MRYCRPRSGHGTRDKTWRGIGHCVGVVGPWSSAVGNCKVLVNPSRPFWSQADGSLRVTCRGLDVQSFSEGHRRVSSFRELRVWQQAMEFALKIYRGTETSQRHEVYRLT